MTNPVNWLEIAAIWAENDNVMSSAPAIAAAPTRLRPAFVLLLALLGCNAAIPSAALAQSSSLFSATPSIGTIAPGSDMRGGVFSPGGRVLAPSQSPQMAPNAAALEAKAKELAAQVPGAQPVPAVPAKPMAAAKPMAPKK